MWPRGGRVADLTRTPLSEVLVCLRDACLLGARNLRSGAIERLGSGESHARLEPQAVLLTACCLFGIGIDFKLGPWAALSGGFQPLSGPHPIHLESRSCLLGSLRYRICAAVGCRLQKMRCTDRGSGNFLKRFLDATGCLHCTLVLSVHKLSRVV